MILPLRQPIPHQDNGYPTRDGRPMAETDLHRGLMFDLIRTLQGWFVADPDTYVSGNLLLFYRPNDKRRHVSPDCFVVFGVPNHQRDNYLIWEEGRGPEVVIELTSKTTRREDVETKFELYRDVLRVKEYFLFDPREEYLTPTMQGFRLVGGEYVRVRPKDRRLPSRRLGLHLERVGTDLRLWDPASGRLLPNTAERDALFDRAEERAAHAERETEAERERAEAERRRADDLQAEVERLRRRLGGGS